jgi:glutaredoxin
MDDTPETYSRESESGDSFSRLHGLGTVGLLFGAVIACLVIMESTTGLPFRMPSSWYVNRVIWYFLGVAGFVGGYLLLRNRQPVSDVWLPTRPGVRFERIVLYTRQDCHLCEIAKEILSRYSAYLPEFDEVDIDSDSDLKEQFGECVPVVEIDGKIRFRGRLNETLLRRLIEGSS